MGAQVRFLRLFELIKCPFESFSLLVFIARCLISFKRFAKAPLDGGILFYYTKSYYVLERKYQFLVLLILMFRSWQLYTYLNYFEATSQ